VAQGSNGRNALFAPKVEKMPGGGRRRLPELPRLPNIAESEKQEPTKDIW